MMKNKKGQVTIYILLFAISLVILIIGAVIAPFGTRFSSEIYSAGAELIDESKDSINQIKDEEIKQEILNTLNTAQDSQQFNIEATSSMYKYSWVFVVLILALIGFLITRRTTEVSGGIR